MLKKKSTETHAGRELQVKEQHRNNLLVLLVKLELLQTNGIFISNRNLIVRVRECYGEKNSTLHIPACWMHIFTQLRLQANQNANAIQFLMTELLVSTYVPQTGACANTEMKQHCSRPR